MDAEAFFAEGFKTLTGHPPLGWQRRLFATHFTCGKLPSSLDIPTGLGKTSVIVIWLLALAWEARQGQAGGASVERLPRRLVYVVNRRTVVDQATDIARGLRVRLAHAAGKDIPEANDDSVIRDQWDGKIPPIAAEVAAALAGLCIDCDDPASPLAISTLRGELADNREWQSDPARAAIVIGTVDMTGSRLVFCGYGVSRKMRPFHAGLLGHDALLVLDEAHLTPAFEMLIRRIACMQKPSRRFPTPDLRVMSLSATGRDADGRAPGDGQEERSFGLNAADREDEIVAQRLKAAKRIKLHDPAAASSLAKTLADYAWERGRAGARVIVYCDRRKTAKDVYEDLSGKLKKELGKNARLDDRLELIVGERRVRERELLAETAVFRRFVSGAAATGDEAEGPAFLVATSAGEVGVDLDADHMVADLVPWERIVQRLGRVNRLGNRKDGQESLVDIFPSVADEEKDADSPANSEKLTTWRAPFEYAQWERDAEGRQDASPGQLRTLRDDPGFQPLAEAATTGQPLRPALTQAVVDAWSMTSLETHPGRPKVEPWLRGWVDEQPQTRLVWRSCLPVREGELDDKALRKAIGDYLDAAPPHVSEVLEARTWEVAKLLKDRARALLKTRKSGRATEGETEQASGAVDPKSVFGILIDGGDLERLLELPWFEGTETKRLESALAGRTVILRAEIGGLASEGLLDPKVGDLPPTLDGDPDPARGWSEERLREIGFRIRLDKHAVKGQDRWKIVFSRFLEAESEELDDPSDAKEWRVEEWAGGASDAEPALASAKQLLAEHHELAGHYAENIAKRLGLPPELMRLLVVVARRHDLGKARAIWQRYAGNPRFVRDSKTALAKFTGRSNPALLKIGKHTYRHEFGSLGDCESDQEIQELGHLRDLALHLIASHHGNARPLIAPADPCAPPSALKGRAEHAALRFARVQAEWGHWPLAWLEMLLRSADVAASRAIEQNADKRGASTTDGGARSTIREEADGARKHPG